MDTIDLVDRKQLEIGTVIILDPPKYPGSDQAVEYLGQLPYPFAPPTYILTTVQINDMVLYVGNIARIVSVDGKEAVLEFLSDLGYVIGTDKVLVSDLTII